MSGKKTSLTGMTSWGSLKRAMPRGIIKFVARALGRDDATVRRWTRPCEDPDCDTGARNPVDWTEDIMRTALGHQVPEAGALAPLHYLAGAFNHVCIPQPSALTTLPQHARGMIRAIGEFGEFTMVHADALEDGKVSDVEGARILIEGNEAVRAILGLMARIQQPDEAEESLLTDDEREDMLRNASGEG